MARPKQKAAIKIKRARSKVVEEVEAEVSSTDDDDNRVDKKVRWESKEDQFNQEESEDEPSAPERVCFLLCDGNAQY